MSFEASFNSTITSRYTNENIIQLTFVTFAFSKIPSIRRRTLRKTMNKTLAAFLVTVLITGFFVGESCSLFRGGRDKIPMKDAADRSNKLRTIYNKMKSAKHYRDSQYKRVKPWMEQKGTAEI